MVPDRLSDCICVTTGMYINMLGPRFMNVPNLGLIFAWALRKSGNLILAYIWSQKWIAANGYMKDLAEIHARYPKRHSECSQRLSDS